MSKRAGLFVALALAACSGGGGKAGSVPAASTDYVVLAWNDLGMHCLNPSYDSMVILPPYNTVWAQVVRRGAPPSLVTQGITVEYRIVGNSHSYGKAGFGGFWDHALELFGVAPAHDRGLNLTDPAISNGLSGTMVPKGDHFQVDGIPLVPIDDAGVWNPFQVAEITVKDTAGKVLVQTRATVPTSDEFECRKCHGANAFASILAKHDQETGTTLASSGPVLCASCHASPALGRLTRIGGRAFLSEAMHGFHGRLDPSERPDCYDCHPGPRTQCSRSLPHVGNATDGNCSHCHGALPEVGLSIAEGRRVPWVQEPVCVDCHAGVSGVDTGATLYRNARGHGGLSCPACHGSPHAMFPSRVASDLAQPLQYQATGLALGTCRGCHPTSRGGGSASEFREEHGGSGAEHPSHCAVCHTSVTGATSSWPHAFSWTSR